MDDNIAIRRLIDLYALGVDCLRFNLFGEIFTRDVKCPIQKFFNSSNTLRYGV